MPGSDSSLLLPTNQLLAALPLEEYQNLLPHLESIKISPQQVLQEANEPFPYVYFLCAGVVSLVVPVEDGSIVEIGLVGPEGVVGVSVFLGGNTTVHRAIVQVSGHALRMKAEVLKAQVSQGSVLQHLLMGYAQALWTQAAQLAVCNRRHRLDQRLACWLLLVNDRVKASELSLTQELISHVLGTRRSSITVAAGTLQRKSLIQCRHGKITILNRRGLERATCECYQVITSECDRLFNIPIKESDAD
ncbi:MAG: Crp/Fnr family transcriptional regulator [Leptolyngbyaceae bacterium]|nr:Crp/Fnr family transcriptional regulator [Leptolyngbyaceae bacterium]